MMNDNQLIAKIKQLKQIKPKEKWALLAKNQILEQEQELPEPVLKTELTSFFAFFRKPAFAFTAAITLVVLLIGAIAGFFYLGEGEQPAEIVKTPAELEQLAEAEQAQAIVLALEQVQLEIVQATEFLKKIEEPQKILEARNAVVPTIEAVREVIVEAEKLEQQDTRTKDNQVLAVKSDIDELENALDEIIAIQAKALIQDFETRTLTEVQNKILEKAKQAYNKGNYTEALVNCLFINQLAK